MGHLDRSPIDCFAVGDRVDDEDLGLAILRLDANGDLAPGTHVHAARADRANRPPVALFFELGLEPVAQMEVADPGCDVRVFLGNAFLEAALADQH